MSKEYIEALECLNRIDNTLCLNNIKGKLEFGIDTEEHTDCDSVIGMTEDLETIKSALHRLESIDNSNPSEALECLDSMYVRLPQWDLCRNLDQYNTIKQVLLKAQKNARSEEILQKYYQEGITLDSVRELRVERDNYKKVLEIVFKKNVDIYLIKHARSIEEYNHWVSKRAGNYYQLTQEEFDTLKEVLENE